jgi:hypothetical protein
MVWLGNAGHRADRTVQSAGDQTSSDARSPFVSSHSLRSDARFFDNSMSMIFEVPS